MSKKLAAVFGAILFFFSFNFALAQVKINEFVSDPNTGEPEWIELRNTSSESVDLNGWSWTELASPGGDNEHEVTPKGLAGNISPGGVLVVEVSGLNNASDSIALYQGTEQKDRVTYGKVNTYPENLSAPSKGKSGALIAGVWVSNQVPTKGQPNPSASEEPSEVETSPNGDNTGVSNPAPKLPAKEIYKAQINVNNLEYAGIPFEVSGLSTLNGAQTFKGRFYWNFGDGDAREVPVINTDRFSHTYFYPGDYVITLEYYGDAFAEVPLAIARASVKVTTASVIISRVGSDRDFFIELKNNSGDPADVSGWELVNGQRFFKIPRGTSIAARGKLLLSPRITGFAPTDQFGLKLLNPNREIAYDFASPRTAKSDSLGQASFKNAVAAAAFTPKLPSEALLARAGESTSEESQQNNDQYFIFLSVAMIFIGAAAVSVYFLRRKRSYGEAGSDFEILDE